MNIYAFYEPLDEFSTVHQDQLKLIELWKKSWIYYGWNPIVYGIKECKLSNDYDRVYDVCHKLPTVNIKTYELYCFLRWLYMGEIGGWYADLDMINYGFTPIESHNKTITTSVVLHCSSIHMPINGYKSVIESFKNLKESDKRYGIVNDNKHFADMYILESMRDIDIKLDIQKEYMDVGYEDAKIVHYHFGIYNKNNTSGKTRTQIILEDPRTNIFI